MSDTSGNLLLVSTTPVANLPPVSMTPAANFATGTTGVVDTGGQFCHRYQQQQRLQWCTLSCQYLREFKKKIETALMRYSGVWWKLIHEKTRKSKNSWHCPFKGPLVFVYFASGDNSAVPRRLFFAAQQRIAITWKPK
jgi:hypothetical protein